MKEIYDGFENIGATDVECKNYRRGLNEFIGNDDAQMVVHKMLSRQEFFEDFSVKYKRDEDTKELVGLFWADAQAKRNYAAFGDVVSFDATFRSNRDTNFKRRLYDIVWTDKIEADVFDEHWNEIMADFKLTEHKWLHDIFELRSHWIPTYFRHEPMSRPMRTTSRPIDAANWSNPAKCVNGVLREIYAKVEDSVTRLVTDIEKLYTYKDELTALLEQLKINIPNPLK
nr:FAR1 DNA binding domain, zinc finger, SWIM-type, MULE transposase domain, FHY3/FAR1 family [Tanacetum cinerariifolium]